MTVRAYVSIEADQTRVTEIKRALPEIELIRAGRFWGLDVLLARRLPQWPIT